LGQLGPPEGPGSSGVVKRVRLLDFVLGRNERDRFADLVRRRPIAAGERRPMRLLTFGAGFNFIRS
jgi:hypothetical protein